MCTLQIISDLPHYLLEIQVGFEWQRKSESSSFLCVAKKGGGQMSRRRLLATSPLIHNQFCKTDYEMWLQQHSVAKLLNMSHSKNKVEKKNGKVAKIFSSIQIWKWDFLNNF